MGTRRTLGECHHTDFLALEHLGDLIVRGEEVDLTTLTKTQRTAVFVLREWQRRKLPYRLQRVVTMVTVWGEEDKATGLEYTFFQNESMKDDITEFQQLVRC